jgi:hypothetical protein
MTEENIICAMLLFSTIKHVMWICEGYVQKMKFILRLLMGKFRSGMCLQAYRFVNCECKFFFFEVVKMESALGEPPKNKYIGNKHDSKFLFPP